jgi:hypothetical protein
MNPLQDKGLMTLGATPPPCSWMRAPQKITTQTWHRQPMHQQMLTKPSRENHGSSVDVSLALQLLVLVLVLVLVLAYQFVWLALRHFTPGWRQRDTNAGKLRNRAPCQWGRNPGRWAATCSSASHLNFAHLFSHLLLEIAMPALIRPFKARVTLLATVAALAACGSATMTGPMGFFITSTNPGNGADLGGLAGADAHCQKLADASGVAGAGKRNWRAYLSASPVLAPAPTPAVPGVNARDRIGKGPWFNAKGALIAMNVEQLHGNNNITKTTALTEKGSAVNGRGDTPNIHDILTGSRPDGTSLPPVPNNQTCGNWTQSGEGSAMTGHHDRVGPVPEPWAQSWNSSHATRGCGMEALKATGGAGLMYCFAAD